MISREFRTEDPTVLVLRTNLQNKIFQAIWLSESQKTSRKINLALFHSTKTAKTSLPPLFQLPDEREKVSHMLALGGYIAVRQRITSKQNVLVIMIWRNVSGFINE